MKPMHLDYIVNGAKVFIYERPSDGHRYASVHDYSRFGVKEKAIVRVKLHEGSTVESVLNDPKVIAALGLGSNGAEPVRRRLAELTRDPQ